MIKENHLSQLGDFDFSSCEQSPFSISSGPEKVLGLISWYFEMHKQDKLPVTDVAFSIYGYAQTITRIKA
jgi:hypothetical protein